MNIQLPPFVLKIVEGLEKAEFDAYIVGGSVRDILMGRPVGDWDFTTNAKPEEILKVFPEGFYNNIYGTVGIIPPGQKPTGLEADNPYEITTFRREFGYSDARRPDKVEWGKSLEEDLSRRDFTINAIALGLANGLKTTDYSKEKKGSRLLAVDCKLYDPFDGQKDLKAKLIRAVGDPDKRFSEDALRMIRAVRIASELGFLIEEKTFEAIKKNAALIDKIAKERVKDELFKIISSYHPYEGMLLFRNSGLMAEILPELENCFGVEQKSPQRHHIYDVGTHLLMSLKECKSDDPVTRFGTLIHDIGKPQTMKKLSTGVITFYNHEMVSTKISEDIADRLRFSNKEKEKLLKLVRWHQFTVGEMQTDSAIRRFIRNVGLENVPDMLALRIADRLGSGARETSWRLEDFKKRLIEVQKQPFSVRDLKIDGTDVMKALKLKPGPKVGEILEKLFKEVEDKKLPNEKKALLKALDKFS